MLHAVPPLLRRRSKNISLILQILQLREWTRFDLKFVQYFFEHSIEKKKKKMVENKVSLFLQGLNV